MAVHEMTAFQIRVGTGVAPSSSPRLRDAERVRPGRGVLDLLVDGTNLTARVGAGLTLPFLRDLAHAVADLAAGRRSRATVPFYLQDDAWELGVVRDGRDALLSVFRTGGLPEVAVHERRIEGEALVGGVGDALRDAIENEDEGSIADLVCARDAMGPWLDGGDARPAAWTPLEPAPGGDVRFGGDLYLRTGAEEARGSAERAELLPLLVRSRFRVTVRGRTRELGDSFAFLLAERLIDLAAEALSCAAQGKPLFRRVDESDVRVIVRLDANGALGLTVRRRGDDGRNAGETFPGLAARDLADAAVAFGRSLGRALVRSDRGQIHNLRLSAFRSAVKSLASLLRPQGELLPRINEAPESYRAYAIASRKATPPTVAPSRLRFSPRWTAAVPGIDLGSTFLCGDRLVVGASRELHCLDRATGEVLWTRGVPRGASVPTPAGLARMHADGTIAVHDYGSGEITVTARLSPRAGGAAAGAVVHAPGLPKMIVAAEGERHLSAIDLVTGEVRWRHTLSRGGPCRVRRAGKLLTVAVGDAHLSALDVQTGEVVWRLCDPRPFSLSPTFDHDTLFAIAGDATLPRRERHRLLSVDAWSGASRFSVDLPALTSSAGSPILAGETVAVPTRDDRGLGLAAFHRDGGDLAWTLPPGTLPAGTALLAVDDAIFANTDRGELIAIDAATGEIRYRLRLAPEDDDASPRKLEPVLRSGALFVPQREVHVLRPRDGAELGKIPCDLIPDVMRVDERCDVFIAEESGHLAAFGAGPRLSLVRVQ
jgi:outer membrane protein assembly factor BamB